MKYSRLLAAAMLLLLFIAAVPFPEQNVLTPEAILSIRTISDVQLSPDGKTIAFHVSRARSEAEKPGGPLGEIWTIPATGGEPVRFTYNDKTDRMPRWSPDGRWLAFLSQRGADDKTQIYLIPRDGGDARQLTKAENSVTRFEWSPDGSMIAYTMKDPKTPEELQAEKEGKDWIIADKDYKHIRLYVVNLSTKETKLITKEPITVHDFDWSPDGKHFILAAAETPLVDDSYMGVRLRIVSADGGEARLLTPTQGKLEQPRWSPDGKWIAWRGATSINDPYAGSIFIVPATGGKPENLLKGYEGTATWLGWKPREPSSIVFVAIERQNNVLHTISLPARKRIPLGTQPIIYSPPSFSNNGKLMALAGNSPKHPNEVFFGAAANKPLKRLTTFNPHLNNISLGEQEVIKWRSVDGWEIEGVLIKPVGFEKGKRYPTVLQAHGGPEAADLNGWLGTPTRWGQLFAGRGFVTLYANYRGSIGRGVEFASADQGDMMGKEFQDMLAGIDYLIKEGITDPERVGIGGGSYGGYTSAWAATYASERFKAAVVWMGISNNISKMGTTDIFWESSHVHWKAVVYENFDLFWDRSPIKYIGKANTPTLIIHGKEDPRVPISQSKELYTALKWKGVPVEFVTYPREEHGVVERAHQYDFMNRVLGWFEKYLKDGLTAK
jgi:dipeptidyl aminopeptidase/acylaminoacyl peptidase